MDKKKNVYCYRLAIEGTLETKVYARSLNKSGVASGVVDGNCAFQTFSREELENLWKTEYFVDCNKCNKRRRLSDLPDQEAQWVCSMNEDQNHNSCDDAEEECVRRTKKSCSLGKDHFLEHLVKVINKKTRHSPLVTKWEQVQSSLDCETCVQGKNKSDSEVRKKRQRVHIR